MNKAKGNFIKFTIIMLSIWFILLIIGLTTPFQKMISNILFGLGTIALFPIVILFFKSKAIKSKPVPKIDIQNYLTATEYKKWSNNKALLEKYVRSRKNYYWITFSISFATILIGAASLFAIL